MADGYDEFLSLLASLPSKDEKKEMGNTRPSVAKDAEAKEDKPIVRPTVNRRSSVKVAVARDETKTADSETKAEKQNVRPTVNRGSSVKWAQSKEDTKTTDPETKAEKVNRESNVKFQIKPQAEPEEEGSWMDDNQGFVHLTDASYGDAFTEVSTYDKSTLAENKDGPSLFGRLTVFLVKIAVNFTLIFASALVQMLWVFILVLLAWIFATLYHGLHDIFVWQMNDSCVLACSEIIHQVEKLDACLSSC